MGRRTKVCSQSPSNIKKKKKKKKKKTELSTTFVCFNMRNKCLTSKILQQGYRYHKLPKTFFKFYRRHYELISKFNVETKTLLREGLSEPEFYGDLVNKFKKLLGRNDFFFSIQKIHNPLQTYRIQLKCHATVCMLSF